MGPWCCVGMLRSALKKAPFFHKTKDTTDFLRIVKHHEIAKNPQHSSMKLVEHDCFPNVSVQAGDHGYPKNLHATFACWTCLAGITFNLPGVPGDLLAHLNSYAYMKDERRQHVLS